MKNKIKWYKGLSVKALIDFPDKEEYVTLTYIDKDKFLSNKEGDLYFSESLFPYAYVGLVMYMNVDSPITQRYCEVVELLE